jgi:uroporphyrinogen decarboxylase
MAYSQPELLNSLIAVLTDATVTYLAAQIEAGAEAVMLFDSWAGVLSPSLFRDLVIAPTTAIVTALRKRYPNVPVIGFPRLAGVMIGSYASETGVQGVAMDTAADPTIAASLVPQGVAIQGNLDPLAVVAGGEVMASEARSILEAMRGRPFIFNLGHGIVPPTPPEHVAALMEIVRAA